MELRPGQANYSTYTAHTLRANTSVGLVISWSRLYIYLIVDVCCIKSTCLIRIDEWSFYCQSEILECIFYVLCYVIYSNCYQHREEKGLYNMKNKKQVNVCWFSQTLLLRNVMVQDFFSSQYAICEFCHHGQKI